MGMGEALEDKFISMECQNSDFESSNRKKKLFISSLFKRDNVIVPCSFQTKTILKNKQDSHLFFKKSYESHKNEILKAVENELGEIPFKKILVLFSGGPAPGGHNVICGLFDVLGQSEIFGVRGGPGGLLRGDIFPIKREQIDKIKNSGGFDFLGTDRTKIKTKEQFLKVKELCKKNNINGIVIIGGDDSNTNSAFLAEEFLEDHIQVIGVPKTIDGDMQIRDYLPITFGFDSATRLYSQLVGNLLKDSLSSLKYWHFVKLMGRSASHVTLEVALQTKATVSLISEEILAEKMTFDQLIEKISNIIIKRSREGKEHGLVLIPEGIIEYLDDFKSLLMVINNSVGDNYKSIFNKLDEREKKLVQNFSPLVKDLLFNHRDAHGNLELSLIPTEDLLIGGVQKYLQDHDVRDVKFNSQKHFFGYEGRCCTPSHFDMVYAYHLGLVAGSLILDNRTGYMASVGHLEKVFQPYAIPISSLLNVEKREGEDRWVIKKTLVDLNENAFKFFKKRRDFWSYNDVFCSPGPIQNDEKTPLPMTVCLNEKYQGVNINVECI